MGTYVFTQSFLYWLVFCFSVILFLTFSIYRLCAFIATKLAGGITAHIERALENPGTDTMEDCNSFWGLGVESVVWDFPLTPPNQNRYSVRTASG